MLLPVWDGARGIALVAGAANSPAVFVTGNNMLIFAHIGLFLK